MATLVEVIDALDGFVTGQTIRVARAAGRNLIEDTPKKSGWAASRWRAVTGDAFESPSSVQKPGKEALSALVEASEAEQAASFASLGSRTQRRSGGRFVKGRTAKVINLPNDAIYISQLNGGSSVKAPAGFVQAAIARAVAETQ